MISREEAAAKISESVRKGESWHAGYDKNGEPVYRKRDKHYPEQRIVDYTVTTVQILGEPPHHSIETELETNPGRYPGGVYRLMPQEPGWQS